ncbi:MAG: hypothetical protein DRN12_04360 [Thermoplasmata archaeon]|nr:MAG: hypothetical protein DRN12_04360 [Thermoplasmata archaeon]
MRNRKTIVIILCILLVIIFLPTVTVGSDIFDETIQRSPIFWSYDRPHDSSYKPDYGSIPEINFEDPPTAFDLRDVDGRNYVTSVKCQSGGTCWAHAILACMESNLLMTGNWEKAGEKEEPNLAEYHLDWWNGFNTFYNEDAPDSNSGLPPHQGAHFRIAAAYFSRGEGAVYCEDANDDTEYDANWYSTPPNRFDDKYEIFYPNDIEIFDIGENLENINLIKNKIMTQGAINIVFRYDPDFIDENYVHYQPPDSPLGPNHNVAIIGWNDNKIVPNAPGRGAWLCKNSWSSNWGLDGYFWISYYDKYCCHPYDGNEWTAAFKDVEPMPYKRVYYHDYHGWQGDFNISNKAFNAFTAVDNEILSAVSFFTCKNNVHYQVRIFDEYKNGELLEELSNASGIIDFRGFHTIKLNQPVNLTANDQFYIYLELSDGGIPYDRTSDVWGYTIKSISHPGESFYYKDGEWHDLYYYDNTANFCIKGLISKISDLECNNNNIIWRNIKPGSKVESDIIVRNIGESFSKLNWKIVSYPDWGEWSFSPDGDYIYPETGGEAIHISLVVPEEKNQDFSGEIKIINEDNPNDYEIIQVSLSTTKNNLQFNLPLLRFLDNHMNLFSMLQQLLDIFN